MSGGVSTAMGKPRLPSGGIRSRIPSSIYSKATFLFVQCAADRHDDAWTFCRIEIGLLLSRVTAVDCPDVP
jgi:hypothetical protein